MGIPEWLQGVLKASDYRSPHDMAMALRIPPPTFYRWLSGEVTPSAAYCMKLAEATATPVEDVIRMAYGDGAPATPA